MRGRQRCSQLEAAHRLGLTVAAVRRLVSAGVIPAESDRGRFCLDVAEVERYAEHRRACGIR
ncbi:MAG: excisionase family DNA-binding protein [Microthrixaceae bacterium]|nr:excisionase family DNA-binding protein [Microthrixaceae bacterium]